MREIKLIVRSELDHVGLIGVAVESYCRLVDLPGIEAQRVELAVVEALNNVIEHAYEYVSTGVIETTIRLAEDKIEITLLDSGKERPANLTAQLNFDPQNIDELPEGGMGLFLIHEIMDDVAYERVGNQNVLTMTKMISEPYPDPD